jgi:phosphoglycerate dehydrogenase-like enzyme
MNLDKVLVKADFVSLHVPYLKATHHLINEERLRRCKPIAFLIKTSRGKVVIQRPWLLHFLKTDWGD